MALEVAVNNQDFTTYGSIYRYDGTLSCDYFNLRVEPLVADIYLLCVCIPTADETLSALSVTHGPASALNFYYTLFLSSKQTVCCVPFAFDHHL